jgi:hypothetical protein
MNRAELDRLDRDALIARAEAAGVARARILTRPELVDELLLRSSADPAAKRRSRGWFGVARDLLARAVERGLNLPDAAERIRTLGGHTALARRSAPAALPTVTLAEIYASQGHRRRAIETLEGVLSREPDHAVAGALLKQLEDTSYPVPPPKMPPEPLEEEERAPAASMSVDPDDSNEKDGTSPAPTERGLHVNEGPREPMHMLDDAPLPTRYDVDECVAITVDPRTLYLYWEVRETTLALVRRAHPGGSLALRILVIEPTWDGPRSSTRDQRVERLLGDFFSRHLPAGCIVRAAIGWMVGETFDPIAHSQALETPPGGPSPVLANVLMRWTPEETAPAETQDADAVEVERGVHRARRETLQAMRREHERQWTPTEGASESWSK